MVSGFHFSDDWERARSLIARFNDELPGHSRVGDLFQITRWNQYVSHWPIALKALRQLWEIGKVSELKSPFYDLVPRSANNRL
jgi:hypothetical protein